MSVRNQMGVVLVSAISALCATQMAFADHHVKSGTYELILSAVTDFATVEQLNHVVRVGTLDGTVTIIKSSGGPFEAGSSGTILGAI